MSGVPVFKLCDIDQITFLANEDKDITAERFNEFAENHADELAGGSCRFEVYDIIFNYLSEELDCDFHALIKSIGLDYLRNPNEGLWDFIVFDADVANRIIPLLESSDEFRLHDKRIGLPEYFVVDYHLAGYEEEFSDAIETLLHHMKLVNDKVLVFLLF